MLRIHQKEKTLIRGVGDCFVHYEGGRCLFLMTKFINDQMFLNKVQRVHGNLFIG